LHYSHIDTKISILLNWNKSGNRICRVTSIRRKIKVFGMANQETIPLQDV
jgi:hypothetical protein